MKKIFHLCLGITLSMYGFSQNSLQQYTPSVLLSKNQMQLKVFNNLYTQTEIRDKNGTALAIGHRESFLNHQVRYLYGLSESARLNIGIEANLTTAWYGGESSGLLFSSIGPTVKFIPIEKYGNFSIQSTFLLPVAGDDLEKPKFVNHNRYTWWTQFFYDHSISDQWNLFLEVDILYRLARKENQNTFFRTPISGILSFFATDRWTIYANAQHAPAYGKLEGVQDIEFGRMRWYTQLGAGTKYLITDRLELELSYANFLWSKRDGAGQVFNFGVRVLR